MSGRTPHKGRENFTYVSQPWAYRHHQAHSGLTILPGTRFWIQPITSRLRAITPLQTLTPTKNITHNMPPLRETRKHNLRLRTPLRVLAHRPGRALDAGGRRVAVGLEGCGVLYIGPRAVLVRAYGLRDGEGDSRVGLVGTADEEDVEVCAGFWGAGRGVDCRRQGGEEGVGGTHHVSDVVKGGMDGSEWQVCGAKELRGMEGSDIPSEGRNVLFYFCSQACILDEQWADGQFHPTAVIPRWGNCRE